jgi:succinate dehydrogenase/fumarate reductase flavoprotein subunit
MSKTVIVIGAGLAGMMAAYAAQREGVDVVLITRGSIGIGSNSALSNGVFSGPTPVYTEEAYIKETLDIGRNLNHRPLLEVIAKGALPAFELLRFLGLPVEEAPNFYHVVKPPHPEIIPGLTLVKGLIEVIRNSNRIQHFTGLYVTELLKNEGRVCGVRCLNGQGKEISIYAPAVVLATGGAGAIYRTNDNQKTIMGQGYYLAAQAGLDLWDMEFVQFIPIMLVQPHLPPIMLFSPYPEGTKVINEAGEDLAQKYGIQSLNEAVRKRRDFLSITLAMESSGGQVYMDYRGVSPSAWDNHPLSILGRMKFDFKNRPVMISPGAHFFMGGVRIDQSAQTVIPGLFACGEIVWGVHGANRRAGNALTECVVLGGVAGKSAAAQALKGAGEFNIKEGREVLPPERLLGSGRYRELREEIRTVAWEKAGILRSEGDMKEGLASIGELESQLRKMKPNNVFQQILHTDLMSACFVVRAVLTTSLPRTESRGSFYRNDFPQEDSNKWLKNSCLKYDAILNEFTVNHFAVQR